MALDPVRSLVLVLYLATAAAAQSTVLLSVDSGGAQGSASSDDPVTSSDGRYTVFASTSVFVTPDTNGARDVFRRDRLAQQTVLVSVGTGGAAAAGDSFSPVVTPNGRFVVFGSSATDLVVGDTNVTYDVFVRDLLTGTTELVSRSSSGALGNSASFNGVTSNDARYVAFVSTATNLVVGDTNGFADVFVRDRTLGSTIRASVSSSGVEANGVSATGARDVQISGDGRFVVFTSNASNLVPFDTNGATVDLFIRDLQLATTAVASLSSFGLQGDNVSLRPGLSFDGRYMAYESWATNMVSFDTNGAADVFVRDFQTGYTSCASVASDGTLGNGSSSRPSISQDGRYVSFESLSSNLVPLAPTLACVYVRDRLTGLTTLESPDSAGGLANDNVLDSRISGNGRFVVFESAATDLVLGDLNGQSDVFLRDRGAQPTYVSYCFGDGFGASCPCGNESAYGFQEGCRFALGYGGKLTATGQADVITDTFVLQGTQMSNSACLYFQGTTMVNNGQGVVFGDGLLCVGGTIVRLGVKFNVLGASRYPDTGDPPVSVQGLVLGGETHTYQVWFRDAVPFCTIATYNLTNAIQVIWTPCPNC